MLTARGAGDVSVPSLTGTEESAIDLANLRGRVVLVDFWATWCAPCRAEIPALNGLYRELEGQGFSLVGFSVDLGDAQAVRAAISSLGVVYPTGLAGDAVQRSFGGIRAVPSKFLIDKSGAIRKQYQGVVPASALRADILELLGS